MTSVSAVKRVTDFMTSTTEAFSFRLQVITTYSVSAAFQTDP